MAWDPSGDVAGLTCRTTGVDNDCTVELVTDSDADFALDDETGVLVETISGGFLGRIEAPSIAWDSSGNAVAGYLRRRLAAPEVVVAHDLDGDGLFTGPNEVVVLDTPVSPASNLGEVAAGPGAAVAYAYRSENRKVTVQRDPEGDGSYVAASATATGMAFVSCVGADYDASGDLVVAYGSPGGVVLWRPASNTKVTLSTDPATACDVLGGAGGVAVVHNAGGLTLVSDRDQDGTLESELVLETPTTATLLELRRAADGRPHIATQDRVLVDPFPAP